MANKTPVEPEQIGCYAGSPLQTPSALTPDATFAEHVDKAIWLQRQAKFYQGALERLKVELREEAQRRLPAGKKQNPAGESVSINGNNGVATISFENPRTIAAFWFQGDDMAWHYKNKKISPLGEMKKIAGKCFARLFRPQHKPTRNFIQIVAGLVEQKRLSKKKGDELLKLCLEESTPKVELEDLS